MNAVLLNWKYLLTKNQVSKVFQPMTSAMLGHMP